MYKLIKKFWFNVTLTLLALSAICYPLFSEITSEFSIPKNYSSMTLYKGIDVNSWRSKLIVNKQINSKSLFTLNQELNLILHHTPGYLRQWKVDELFDFNFNRKINDEYSTLIEGSWDRYIDQKAVPYEQIFRPNIYFPDKNLAYTSNLFYNQPSDISRYYFGVGGAVLLPKIITAEVSVGPVHENRHAVVRKGVRMQFKLDRLERVDGLSADGWMNRLNIGNDYGWKAAYTANKQLSENAYNRSSIYYNQNKQYEDLFESGSFGQRRDEQIQIYNQLVSKASERIKMTWQSELNRRRSTHIREDSEKSDLDFGWKNRFEFGVSGEKWQGVSYGSVDLQEQQYAGGLSQGNRKSLGLGVVYFPSILDSVSFRTLVIKYSYDTPDVSDFNDRDELRYKFVFASGIKITPELNLALKLETDLRHLVYIFRSRSGENRWQRVFRLTIDIPWQRKNFRNVSHYAVISNYTDYDYLPAADNLSRVYRAFTLNDTVTIDLSDRVSFEVNFAAIIDDHGRLQWSDWVQNLSEEGRGYTTTVVGTWNGENSKLKYGWNWHTRKTDIFLQTGDSSPGESNYTQGPILNLRSNWGNRLQSDLTARWAYVIDRQRGNYRIPDIRYQLIWALG